MQLLVDRYTTITPEIERQLQTLAVPISRITAIPNGVDTDFFRPPEEKQRAAARACLNLSDSDQVVLYLGRLVAWKQVDLLLEAWAQLARPERDQLLVVGTGSEYSRLKALAEYLKIQVRFEGPTDNALTYLQAADIFVLPSGVRRTASYEGLSVALIEAMSTGLAVIATDCPGNRVLVQHNFNGLLCAVEDTEDLANQIRHLLEAPALRRRLGRNARASVMQDYSIHEVAHKTRAIYEQLNNGR
jgi:glycosyltransferase involved in cell wall biosynthesis